MVDDNRDDPDLDGEQRALVERLTPDDVAEIDAILLDHVAERWRKVAMVVALAMSDSSFARPDGIPDTFYAERIGHLAHTGVIESQGNLRRMRYSEVRKRLAPSSKTWLH